MKAEQLGLHAFPMGRAGRGVLVAAVVALFGSVGLFWSESASAADVHPAVTGTYGKEGPTAAGIGNGCAIAYQSAEHHLYLFSDEKIYGLDRTAPGTVSLLPGYPVTVATPSFCSGADIAVDNTAGASKGHIYTTYSNSQNTPIHGYDATGAPLGSPWPVSTEYGCGLGITSTGELWVGEGYTGKIDKISPTGTKNGQETIPTQFCHIAIDPITHDVFTSDCCSPNPHLIEWKASGGYTYENRVDFGPVSGQRRWAFNGAAKKLYNPIGNEVEVFDTETGDLLESLNPGGEPTAVAVDEATDDVYVTVGSGATGRIKEFQAKTTPTVTTGNVTESEFAHGTVELAGGPEVTSCVVEYGFDKKPPGTANEHSVPCEPATPYAADTSITATLTSLVGESLYHYRVVASNVNGTTYGHDQTFVPHFVEDVVTETPENVTTSSATLKASFTGNGKDTHYYFEYDQGEGSCPCAHKTATPPGDDAGSPVGHTVVTTPVSGLTSDTKYHYRVVMENSKGLSPGPNVEFDSAHAVTSLVTEPPSEVTSYAATLESSWNGNGEDTHYYFEWGFASTPYEHVTPDLPGADGGSATGPQTHGSPLAGLIAYAEYHYRVVAYDGLGTSYGQEVKFRTAKLPAITYELPSDYTTTSVNVHASINPNGVGDTTYHVDYGLDTTYGSSTPESGSIGSDSTGHSVTGELTELIPGATYHYRIVATGPGGTFNGADQTLTTVPSLPSVAASSVSEQTIESARITASVSPGNGSTVVFFEYGTTEDYGSHSIPGPALPADTTEHTVSATLSGLIPNQTYHYRVVAINFGGSSQSQDRTFTTAGPPRLGGAGASGVTKTSAMISTQISPNLASTTYHVEYGRTLEYGSNTPESSAIGSDQSLHAVSQELSGLAPGTTYHARVVGTNAAGPTYGEDVVFKTVEESTPPPPPVKCKKGFVRKHGKCVKRPKHHHRKKHHHGKAGR